MTLYKKAVLSMRIETVGTYKEVRDCISNEWYKLFSAYGLLPFLVPNDNPQTINEYLKLVEPDIIFLSGGNSISIYDSVHQLLDDDMFPIRDMIESLMIQYGIDHNIPIIGVCRGMHMINMFFHGSVDRLDHEFENHVRTSHELTFHSEKLGLKDEKIIVNSYHNYGIKHWMMGQGLRINALSSQNIVEAFEHETYKIFGIQWHPERMEDCNVTDMILKWGDLY